MPSILSRGARFEPVSEDYSDSDDGSIQESPLLQQDQFDQFEPQPKQSFSNPAKLTAPAPVAPKAPPRDTSLRQTGLRRLSQPGIQAGSQAGAQAQAGAAAAAAAASSSKPAKPSIHSIQTHPNAANSANSTPKKEASTFRRSSAGSDLQFGQSRPKSMFIRPSPNPEGTERGRNLSFMPLGGSDRRTSLPVNGYDDSAPLGPISGPANPPQMSSREAACATDELDAPMGPISGSEKPPVQSGRWSALPTSGAAKEDDDILPFAATKMMASEGRPLSAIALPSIQSNLTMSHERYENYRKSLSSLEMLQRQGSQYSTRKGAHDSDSDNDNDEQGLLDNDREQRRETARRRQEQDAHLSLYRQKMTKVIGTGKPGLPAPATAMTSTTYDVVEDDEDDDLDDVPLAALRSLNFPHRRPPQRSQTLSSLATTEELAPPAPGSPQRSPRPGSQGHAASHSNGSQNGLGHVRRSSSDNLTPLPRVFDGENKRVSRGLVAVIAKEEDAKVRRRSMPLGALGGFDSDDRRHTMSAAPSFYGGADLGDGSEATITELRQQLNHLAEMQQQMFQQLNGPPMGGPGQGPVPGAPYPGAASIYSPSLNGFNRASRPASLRSYASAAAVGRPQPRPMSSMTFGYGSGHQSPQTLSSADRRESMRSSMAPPPHTPPSARQSPDIGQRTLNNRPSMMRLVNADEDDDDDDDEEWRQMLEKRQGLRSQWQRAV